jgi:serine/threonine protein kinase
VQQNDSNRTKQFGTIASQAPENFDQRHEKASDVYAFGVMIWGAVLTAAHAGSLPWSGLTPAQIMKAVLSGERPSSEHIHPSCPEDLLRLMRRCWAPDPRDRPSFEMAWKELSQMCATMVSIVLYCACPCYVLILCTHTLYSYPVRILCTHTLYSYPVRILCTPTAI